ncbi:MAG TPA: efflux RND transporter periplasmic adaptor subunit [Terriglobia bacterium]|nr:efflux RND transporter periplasmic adaptor subunit [Terriglobia bacterium]
MGNKVKTLWSTQRGLIVVAGLFVLAGAGFAAVRLVNTAPKVPTAEVKRGVFTGTMQIRGQLKALKSVILTAPAQAGQDMQILKLPASGEAVKPGDVVVEFDATKMQQTLEEKQSELKQAEAEIEQTRAQARLKAEQDTTDVMKAKFAVETARLDASQQEILSKIDGEEKKLALADAEQKLKQAETQRASDAQDAAADLEGKKQTRDKAKFEVHESQANIARLTLRAPIAGLVTLLPNFRSGNWMNPPPFRQGDQAWPGAGIVELPDLSTLEVEARVDEVDRGRLKTGLPVTVRVDAVPDKEFSARIADISTLAKIDFSGGWPFPRNFDLAIRLDQTDPRLRPGMSASIRAAVEQIPNALLIPSEASFQKSGQTVAYVLRGSKFEERPIEIARRGEGQLAVASGLKPGDRVALRDPAAGR